MKTASLTVLALLAFAVNSVLCRLALQDGLIDAAGFTTVRLLSGALMLVVLVVFSCADKLSARELFQLNFKSLKGSLLLFIYALCFSYAYLILETGSGALILFGAVQITLLIAGFLSGNRPKTVELFGVVLAFIGLLYWLLPSWGTPSALGFLLMTVSGVAWGLYTLAGKGVSSALLDTSKNFLFTLPCIVVLNLTVLHLSMWSTSGIVLAILSGALTSGIGYAIWYAVLPHLTSTVAGVVQLIVPILAAIGGVIFAAEEITWRLLTSSILVMGGIILVMWFNWHQRRRRKTKVIQ